MKKRNFVRMISFVLVIALALCTLTACKQSSYDELGELVGVSDTQTPGTSNPQSTNANTTDEQSNDCSEELAALQAELDAANKALEEANASIKTLEDSNAALTAELNAKDNPFTFDEEGNPVSINLEDAEELLRVEMENGTVAYRIGKGTPIDVIDEVVLKSGKPYAEQTFELAHHKSSVYVIAGVDSEGNVQVLRMVNGTKLYAYNDSWAQPKAGEGFELLETKKMFGKVDIAVLFAGAICVYEDAESEWGYSLCLNTTGEYVAPSKPSAPSAPVQPKPEQPTDEPSKEEPTDKPSDEKPSDDKPNDEPTNKPENNPEPDEDEDNNSGNEPENNPPLDETDDVPAGEGPADMQENNPPADQNDSNPGDMNDGSDENAPADMQENNPVDTTVDTNAPADMMAASDNSVAQDNCPADIATTTNDDNAPADMQENSPPVEDEVCETVVVTVTVDVEAPADCGNTNNSSADNGPADIADGPADM